MCRRRRSPRGAVLEEDGDAVRRFHKRRRQAKLARLPGGAPDLEGFPDVVRDNLRHRGVAVNDGDRTASSYPAQVLAQVRLQIRDPDLPHDLIMVITSHIVKPSQNPPAPLLSS